MARPRALSAQTVVVLEALAAQPAAWRYGYDLGREVRLKSGSLYPILIRLAERELLEATWDTPRPGTPPRHLYRVTALGQQALAALDAQPHRQSQRGISQVPREA